MRQFKHFESVDLICFIRTIISNGKNSTKYYHELILLEITYNKRQISPELFSGRLILFKRGLELEVYFRGEIFYHLP